MSKLLNIKNKVLKNVVHYLTSDYKTRNSNRSTHQGMDMIGKNKGTDYIVALRKGRVVGTGYNSSTGYYVRINHGEVTSVYYHLKKGTIKVKTVLK